MEVTGVVLHVPAFFYWDVTNRFLNWLVCSHFGEMDSMELFNMAGVVD